MLNFHFSRRRAFRVLRSTKPVAEQIFIRPERTGAAAVEFAVVAPIMILFMFGMVEIGGLMMVKNAAVHASREAARLAVTPTATNADVEARVYEQLQMYTSSGITVQISPEVLSSANAGDPISVRVSVDTSALGLITGAVPLPISHVSAETTMRRETTN